MRRLRNILLVSLALVMFLPLLVSAPVDKPAPSIETFQDTVARVSRGVVYVRSTLGKLAASGSGFILTNHTVVTARHVVKGATAITFTTEDGIVHDVLFARVSPDEDVAVLFTMDALNSEVTLAGLDSLRRGDMIFTIGAPYGNKFAWTVVQGVVGKLNAKVPFFSLNGLIVSGINACPGNSGGPLFNAKGEVVGIVVGMVGRRNYLTIIIPLKSIMKYITYDIFYGVG